MQIAYEGSKLYQNCENKLWGIDADHGKREIGGRSMCFRMWLSALPAEKGLKLVKATAVDDLKRINLPFPLLIIDGNRFGILTGSDTEG